MPGLLPTQPHRRRPTARRRDRFRPWLEELEPRTVFAVGSAAFPGPLALSQLSPAPVGASPFVSQTGGAFTALPQSGGAPGLNTINPLALGQLGGNAFGLSPTGANLVVVAPPLTAGLGQPSSSPGSAVVVVEAQVPILSPATLSPGSLPLNSTAPLNVLDPANYLLARGLNPSLNAGNLPSLLVTQTMETALETGTDGGGMGNNPPTVNTSAAPAPAGVGPTPEEQEQIQQRMEEALRFLSSARPVAHDLDAQADLGPAGAVPFGAVQACIPAEALVAVAADSEG